MKSEKTGSKRSRPWSKNTPSTTRPRSRNRGCGLCGGTFSTLTFALKTPGSTTKGSSRIFMHFVGQQMFFVHVSSDLHYEWCYVEDYIECSYRVPSRVHDVEHWTLPWRSTSWTRVDKWTFPPCCRLNAATNLSHCAAFSSACFFNFSLSSLRGLPRVSPARLP